MTKRLNIIESPYITSRASIAFQLGAIQSLPQYNDAWLCNEFINLRYMPEDKIRCDFLHKDFWFINDKMFIRQSLLFSKETIDFKSFDVIKYITAAIDAGKYVTGDFNAYYIPDKIEYRTINKRDTYLIYGYNLLSESFNLLGNTREGYSSFEVGFNDYILSISNRDDGMFNLNVMEYNPDFLFQFSRDKLRAGLINYVNSQDSSAFYDVTTPIYGLAAIEKLKDDVLVDYGLGRIFKDKSFHVLYEHKKLMLMRVHYLHDHTEAKLEHLFDLFEEVLNISKMVLVKIDEFETKRALNIFSEIISLMDELIFKDRLACSLLIGAL